MSWVRRNTVWMCSNHLYRAALLGLYLWPIILFLSSHLTGPCTFPKMCVQLSSKMYPSVEAYGCISTLIMGQGPFPFQPQRGLPEHVQTGKSSLTSEVGTFSSLLQQNLAFTTSFVLGVSGWEQSLNFTPLDKYQVSGPEARYLLPQYWQSGNGER